MFQSLDWAACSLIRLSEQVAPVQLHFMRETISPFFRALLEGATPNFESAKLHPVICEREQPRVAVSEGSVGRLADVAGGILPPGKAGRTCPLLARIPGCRRQHSVFAGRDARLYGRQDARRYVRCRERHFQSHFL